MKLRAILFDAGGVLYYRPRRWQPTRVFLSELNLSYVDSNHPGRKVLKLKVQEGKISEEEYHEALLNIFGVQDPFDRLRGREILYKEERDIEFFEGVAETLHGLKNSGYLLGVVTNTFISTDEKREWFRRIGIDEIWDSFATSCEIGIVKPDPRIYRAALDPLGVPANASAFVGHSAGELKGAQALGMVTIAFNQKNRSFSADYVLTQFKELIDIVVAVV
ncbi:MAG: HAD hydrolase-like protein [Anaerolineales bacterium]|nr:HAD hydrolase-like protein [Anaerolineales bacterium]